MAVIAVCAILVALGLGLAIGCRITGRRATRPAESPTVSARPTPTLPSQVLEMLRHGVVVVDRDERVVLVNPAARAMGILATDRLAFDELSRLARASTDGNVTVHGAVDLPMGRLGREPIALSVTAVPLPEGMRVAAVVLLLDDVTEVRRLEAVRRDFVANVSHELKTPVGALTLLAEAVQDASDDPDAVQRFAGRMQHESARLGRLVRELIELSRLQGAEPLPGAAEVTVGTLLDEAQDRTRLAAETAGISVVARYAEDLVVRGNESQLTMAITNLVDNAIAYSPRGTRVAVSARSAEDPERQHPCVEISVSDQGLGIAESELTRVFERFYRVDPARSRATGGTGLGLAIVKHVATNHGGTVSVWSVEGAGSTFTIRLPLVNRPARSSDQNAPAKTLAKGAA
ncbi:MAG TPA: ATP-binding protein [Jatrophihabitantaceae bacterium]|nr:ATP-binding protein [Jatrophihabitantaceae bacterium]